MSEKFNIFFVESPLQLISATQVRDLLKIKKTIIFINIHEKNNNNHKQIMSELDSKWAKVHIFYNTNLYLGYFLYFSFLFKLFFKYRNRVERLFYGEYRNPDYAIYEACIAPRESILLDDGAVTIAMQKKFIKQNKSVFEIKGLKKKLFKKLLLKPRKPNLFTFFDLSMFMLPGQTNYYNYKSKKENHKISVDNSHYFIGGKLSEAGYMKENDELYVLSTIFKHYYIDDFYYIPHREESEKKLNKIKKIGFKIKNLNQPIENYYLSTNIMPVKVLSYYSTALYTCYLNFNSQVDLVAVDVREYLTSKVSLENVNIVYDYYADIGMEIKKISFQI
ncbi:MULTISPECIES: hypothetical protein [unclassified Pseudoalteromonas]|uniref:hypothetical protein n=1 Tax=unclassified Pseudoalteromonas TaxID=194690 RepID=UPI0015F740B5|nr:MULTISPECIES: hypothetical protein [unclassified Pseudoalteromonas]MBA6409106.1 hypothetical protein [Pseudoalteromonas sp. 5Ae-yellow]MDN3389518.1 hypothetical protein [Pseudoalteromonas sp. APC 3691]